MLKLQKRIPLTQKAKRIIPSTRRHNVIKRRFKCTRYMHEKCRVGRYTFAGSYDNNLKFVAMPATYHEYNIHAPTFLLRGELAMTDMSLNVDETPSDADSSSGTRALTPKTDGTKTFEEDYQTNLDTHQYFRKVFTELTEEELVALMDRERGYMWKVAPGKYLLL